MCRTIPADTSRRDHKGRILLNGPLATAALKDQGAELFPAMVLHLEDYALGRVIPVVVELNVATRTWVGLTPEYGGPSCQPGTETAGASTGASGRPPFRSVPFPPCRRPARLLG